VAPSPAPAALGALVRAGRPGARRPRSSGQDAPGATNAPKKRPEGTYLAKVARGER
jgi:hypothetical protein